MKTKDNDNEDKDNEDNKIEFQDREDNKNEDKDNEDTAMTTKTTKTMTTTNHYQLTIEQDLLLKTSFVLLWCFTSRQVIHEMI